MNTVKRNDQLLQGYERVLSSEELLSVQTHEGLFKIAQFNEENHMWEHLHTDFDNILGSILDVDVNKHLAIDVEVVKKEMVEKIKLEAQWALKADFESVVIGLKELEDSPISQFKKEEPAYQTVKFWEDQIVTPWLAAPIIHLCPDYQEKFKQLEKMIENYTDLKLYFDNYVNNILPTYRSLLSNESMKTQLSDDKKQNFMENMEYLKKLTVKEARKYLKEQVEITVEKISILFKEKVSSSEELLELLNK